MDLTHKSCCFLVWFLSFSVFQSLQNAWFCTIFTVFQHGLVFWYSVPVSQEPFSFYFNFILNFKTSVMILFILSQFIISNFVQMFSFTSTKFTLHFTLISNRPRYCLWSYESSGNFKPFTQDLQTKAWLLLL